jgi:methylated-DNA-[protein]-cysteine S-methyltransferase
MDMAPKSRQFPPIPDWRKHMRIAQPFCEIFPTVFGTMGIVWWNAAAGPRIRQVFLNNGRQTVAEIVRKAYPNVRPHASALIAWLAAQIQRSLAGKEEVFDLGPVAMEVCRPFQRQVLLAEYGIPRGWVSTYGKIARHIGVAGGSRAVGRALAENPFPIIIPCHRAVRTDGTIGGYQGGGDMKRALLTMEGVAFTDRGTVSMQQMVY